MDGLEALKTHFGSALKDEEILAPFTSFKIGGPASWYLAVHHLAVLETAVTLALHSKIPYFILGRGSNVLISDNGFKGFVIHNRTRRIKVHGERITADSGIHLGMLSNTAKEHRLTGLEFAAGIPGSLGGAIRGNAGACGQEMKDVLTTVAVIDEKGKIRKRSNSSCNFRYRESIFKQNREVILEADFILQRSTKEMITKKVNTVIQKKRFEQEFESPSAGCIFKNPKVPFSIQELESRGIDPSRVNEKGEIPASYLIDTLGLKGRTIGKIMVSRIHANFIINLGHGRAEDVIMLIGMIKHKVRNAYGVQLQEEIQYVGF